MNLNPLGVVLFAVGALLIYSAIKDKDPRAVVREALGQGKAPVGVLNPSAPAPSKSGGGPLAPKAR